MFIQSIINRQGILEVFLTILPGLILAILTNDHVWLSVCFFAVCGMMPFRFSYTTTLSSIIHLAIICLSSFCLVNLLKIPTVFCLNLLGISFLLGYIEFSNHWMKTANSYFFIGIIYSTFKLQYTSLSYTQDIQIFLLSVFSIILGLIFVPKPQEPHVFVMEYNLSNVIYYAKYVLPVTICLLFWRAFNIQEAEWLIWSSLSVFNLEFDQSKKKINKRLVGGFMGVATGLILTQIIPENSIFTYCYFAGILLSLRAFNSYVFAFTIRCALVILFANHNFIEMGKYRLLNIFLGGVIGLFSSWLFDIYLTTRSQKVNTIIPGDK